MTGLVLQVLCAAIVLSSAIVVVAPTSTTTATIHHNDSIGNNNATSSGYIISSIFPNAGPTVGGTDVILSIDIDVNNYENIRLSCVFGGDGDDGSKTNNVNATLVDDVSSSWLSKVDATWISPNEILCVTPSWKSSSSSITGDDNNVSLSIESNNVVDNVGTMMLSPPLQFFYYYESPIIKSIFPTMGSSLGGTVIKLHGSGFIKVPTTTTGMKCKVGSIEVPTHLDDGETVSCITPPGIVNSTHVVSLSFNHGIDYSYSSQPFRYTEPLVRTIWPTLGSTMGGTTLTIDGDNFEDTNELKCIFRLLHTTNHSVLTTDAEFVSSTQLKCISPAVECSTNATVHATVNGVDTTSSSVWFEFIEDAVISSISPNSGPIDGGTVVTLIGSGMINGESLQCIFGEGSSSKPVSGQWISETEIQCIAPLGDSIGVVNVTLSLNGLDYTTSAAEFLYYEHPTISSIYPTFGVSHGGTPVIVNGYGFQPSKFQDVLCRFERDIYTKGSFNNETSISCISPGGNAGSSYLVSVSLNGVDFSPSSVQFRYSSQVEVHSISPKWSDEAGGTILKVFGEGYEDTDDLACLFQNRQTKSTLIRAEYLSATELQCATPPKTTASEVVLKVTVNGADTSSSTARFEYVSGATVSTIKPVRGLAANSTQVTLHGDGFLNEDTIRCRFGESIVKAKWFSRTMIRCVSPLSASASTVVVSYSNDGINFVDAPMPFSFIIVSNVEPQYGTNRGATEVQISGYGFNNAGGWKCIFGESSVPTVFASTSEIRCLTPAYEGVTSVDLALIDPEGSDIKTGFTFDYYEDLELVSLFPESSPISGGAAITIKLNGLQFDSSYACVFGNDDLEVPATLINNSFVECSIPPRDTAVQTTLTVKASNSSIPITTINESVAFTFYEQPSISSASLSSFYAGFSTDIKVSGGLFFHSSHAKCRLGEQKVTAQWLSDSEIVCAYTRYSIEPGTLLQLPFAISMNGVDYYDSGITLDIYPHLTIDSIHPSYGSIAGSTRVTVSGTGFVNSFRYRCLFGTKFTSAEFSSPNEIICGYAPLSLPGRMDFWLCVGDDDDCVGGEELAFEFFVDSLHLLDVQPMEGSLDGGTLVQVTSNHPFCSLSTCSFGNEVVNLEAIDDDTLGIGVCESPPYTITSDNVSSASVAFSISANGQESSHEPFQFVYHENLLPENVDNATEEHHARRVEEYAVHVSHISPTMGLKGTNIAVFGSGFAHLHHETAVCAFGLKHVPIVSVSNTTIMCASPWNLMQLESALFNVMDSSDHVQIYAGDDNITFTYVEMPSIISVEPAVILKTNASTSISVEGNNFHVLSNEYVQCRVGPSKSTARFDTSTGKAICYNTFPVTGSFPFELLNEQYGIISSSHVAIQVIEMPRLHHLEPPIVVVQHDNTNSITLKGENFYERNLSCFINDQQSHHSTFISDSEVLCDLPVELQPGTYEVRISNDGGAALQQSQYLTLEVISPPSMANVIPSIGEAGSKVTITGKSFHPQMECQFGTDIVETQFINTTLIQCQLPLNIEKRTVSIALALDGAPISTELPLFFTFVDLSIASINPRFGDITGGTRVTFNMKDEKSRSFVSHCKVGDIVVPAIISNQSELVCISPPMHTPGSVYIGVSVNGDDFSVRRQLIFDYTTPASFSSMHPTSGSDSGGTVVALAGSNFRNSSKISCNFGAVNVAGKYVSDEKLICETPSVKPGNYTVGVTLNGVDVLKTQQVFHVYPRMTASFAQPSFGETGGGTQIQVIGTNFRFEDDLRCRFGSVNVNARYIHSAMGVECSTPKWEIEEHVELVIASENGETTMVPSGFDFYTPFRIASIHPSNGFTRGGTDLTVKGDHFSQILGPVQCLIGNIAVEAVVTSDVEITCTTPPSLFGGDKVEFALVYGSDKFTLHNQTFQYEDEIVLDAVLPDVIPSTIDKLVTVYGSMFRNRTQLCCMITTNLKRIEATYISESQVLCRVPKALHPGIYSLSVSNNGQDYAETTSYFSVIDSLLVKRVYPSIGEAGSNVSLEGNNFKDLNNLGCLVDEKYIVPSQFINTTLIRCQLPLNIERGTASIALVLDDVPISIGPPSFFTFVDLTLTSINPTFGDNTGGTRVTFSLKEESPQVVSHCIFGEVIVPSIDHDDEAELVCVSPPMHTPGPVQVGVSVNGEDLSMSELLFNLTKPAVFSTMNPTSVSEMGGTVIVIKGSNFAHSDNVVCFFGNVEASGQWMSDEELTCETPSMKPGNYKVRVTLNGVDTLRTSWQFTFHKEIDVLYASPSSGSIHGGTEISIIGKSFSRTDDLTCQFGILGYSKAAFVTSTEVLCSSPDVSNEVLDLTDVDLRISLNGVDFSSASANFRFTPPPRLHSIYPNEGSISGGTQVTINGTDMFSSITSNTAVCIFGNETVPASLPSSEELTCVSPPHSTDEEVFFGVSLNGVDLVQYQVSSSFLYLPIVKTVSIEPSGGPFTGGTLVIVTGDNFTNSSSMRCKFGSSYSDRIVYISEYMIQCRSPPHSRGTVSFVVIADDDDDNIKQEEVTFEYYKPPTILFASPRTGPHHGGTLVRIYGSDFRSNVKYLCSFGAVQVPGQFVASDAIECPSPEILPGGSVDDQIMVNLTVSERSSNFTANTLQFTFVPAPSLTRLSPQFFLFDGGDSLLITGSNLNTTGDVWCRFSLPTEADENHYYETIQAISVFDNEHIACQVPAYSLTNTQVEAFVEVSTNGWDYSAASLSFKYTPKPRIQTIHPSMGTVNGGTVVTVHGADFLQESNLWCAFGKMASVPASWLSHDIVSCKSPSILYPANVSLSLHFEENSVVVEGSQHFAYHRELSLEEAYPMRGFVHGDTTITITGTGFLDVPTLSCQFGSLIVPAKFNSHNSIECLSPQVNQAQCVELKVSLNEEDFSSFAVSQERGMFTYDEEIDLYHTIPTNVPVYSAPNEMSNSSGTISVIGSAFPNSTSLWCRFGEKHVTTAHYVGDTEVKCDLPELTEPGKMDVRISLNNGFDFSRNKTSIAFAKPTLISSISPQQVQEGQAIDILVKGENFIHSSGLKCRFGRFGHLWSPAQWIDSTTLKCMTPPLNMTHDGVEHVAISNNGGYHTGQVAMLGVTARVRFISMHPTLGYVSGGTDVVITLGNAKYMSNLICQFGNEDVPATLHSGNSVLCKSPAYHQNGDVSLKLISDGVHLLATGMFEYISPPQITSLQPTLGPLEGGTTIFMSGNRFTGVSHCRFTFSNDFQIAVPANVQSDSSLQCDAPAYEKDVDALVELTHNEQDYVGNGHMFTYRAKPRMLNLSSSYGSDLGGKTIYISGENFVDTPVLMCQFGTSLVDAVYISRTLLSCEAPAMKIGRVPVSITANGVDFITTNVLEYQSIKLPQLKTMEPTVGIVNGNTTVIISTTALHKNETFDGEISCYFGEHKVSATYLSSNSVSCVAPPLGTAGVLNVSLSVDGERYLANGLNTLEFTYASKPEVTSISPNFGWTLGGVEVTLAVNDLEPFLSSEMACSFGDSNNFTVALQVSNDTVVCTSPPFEETMEQHASIVLLVGNGTNSFHIKSSAFSYYEPSVVTKIYPEIGSIRGGSSMKVSGTNFSDIKGLQCQFGEDTTVDAEFVNEREIQCVVPEWKGGPKIVDVHISIKDSPRLSLVSHSSFEYLTHPSIQSIYPQFGSTKGGTLVSIRGNELSWPDAPSYLSCQFGNSSLVPVTAVADNGALICISPPRNDAASMSSTERPDVPVSIFAKQGHVWLATSDDRFVYSDHIEVNTLGPNSGPATGGTIVTISAQDMHHLPITAMTCHFGSNIVPASYFKDKDVLKCISPAIGGDVSLKTVILNLGINGLRDVESIGRVFTYYSAPSISSISVGPAYKKLQNGVKQNPPYGFLEGGEDVFVSGKGFRNIEGLGCRFDNAISPKVVWLSETSIICTSPSLADTKRLTKRSVRVQVTNNGLDYTDIEVAPEYRYIHRPDASKVEPETVDWKDSTNITITGKSLLHASACVFGDDNKLYHALNVTNNSIICEAPPATQRLPQLSGMEPKIPIFLELDNGIIATGLELTYKKPIPEIPEAMSDPQIISLLPSHGSSDGGDLIRVQGEGFFNTEGLACLFGQTLAEAFFISESEVRCRTPRHLPGKVTFDVLNSGLAGKNKSSGFDFTFLSDLSLSSIFPSFGSIKGDTIVSLFGSFPSLLGTSELNIKCKFGDGVVAGELVNQNEISCTTPRSAAPETVEVTISLDGGHNFAKSSIWFSYVHESEIESLHPHYGYPDGGASISVVGKNFRNSTGLKCLFGEKSVPATFISKDRVTCISPSHEMKRNGNKVAIKLASDGEVGSSWKYFKYVAQPNVASIHPFHGHSFREGIDVTVKGSGFRNVMQLMCRFGKVKVQAKVIDSLTVTCPIPRHPPEVVDFHIIDQYAYYTAAPTEGASKFHFIPEASIYSVNPTWNATQAGMVVFARGTNFDTSDDIACAFGQTKTNATVMSGSLLLCQMDGNMDETQVAIGLYGSIHYAEDSIDMMKSIDAPTAPNGTIMNHNITLCEPGTFQPQNGQEQCLPCPVGYVCPSFGLSKPVLCPAGSICERLGLVVPSSPCLTGHYCEEGTKMSTPIASSTTGTWLYDDESGVLTTVMTNSAWDYVPRTLPATGERRISHPPFDMYVKAQQPFPCPVGFFCREGVSSIEHREEDYTTPQPCFDGYFCPRGSNTPEGTGSCPSGYYCPSQILAIRCPIAHYCPGTGNTSPLPCFPGSYSPIEGLSNCKLCEIGYQCPGFERSEPQLCQAGWVCDEEGTAIPTKKCPSGFYCERGTTTDDPTSPFGVVPQACPAGTFCLEGVAHGSTSPWLPSLEINALAPQPGLEGYYYPSNSSTMLGGGRCFPGHYCPEKTPYPIQTPPGAFAGDDGGAIVGSLCLPGTFSPQPGQTSCSPCPAGSSCLSYGTYVPRICGPGTYRSKADSVQCKPCPEKTYSFASGLTDISQCLPCAEGRVCGSQGMTNLEQSDVCSEGHVCGYMTDRSTLTSLCPAGSYCGNETTTLNQYEHPCLSGSYCKRGTSNKLKIRDKCSKNYYCTPGTSNSEPFITRCARQTTSQLGAEDMNDCSPNNMVAICDKMPSRETNPFDSLSYYPMVHDRTDSNDGEESIEMLVVKKILPYDKNTSDVMLWKNDTLEVFRTCPTYGVLENDASASKSSKDALTVIGRNFYNTTTLTCRYRLCLGSTWVSNNGVVMTRPENCKNGTSTLSEQVTKMGTFISKSRVSCPIPTFDKKDFLPLNISSGRESPEQLCFRDDKGQMFLSRECSSADLSSNQCAFEDAIPSLGLRKRIYSLVMPCSENEILNGWCDNVPTASSKLNPCLVQKMIVDVSNSGKKYSGDITVVPYSSLDSTTSDALSHDGDASYQVHPTYAIYEFIVEDDLEILELENTVIEKKQLRSSFDADGALCNRSSVHEEGLRLGEDGWFESPFMSRFHLSFDWRHIPNYLLYDEHYKLAIYAVPSRCRESRCNDSGRSHIYVENIPCKQPVDLPVWFTDDSINKNQVMNMTLTSLDDSRFRVEIQIINGLALPIADLFEKTMTVTMEEPQRANTVRGKRNMSPLVSFEEKAIDMPYIFGIRYDESHSQQVSLPMNMPPRWKSFERGRVLIGMNTTHENEALTIKDGDKLFTKGTDYWDNPYASASKAKQQSDLYFETFHGVTRDPSGSYKYDHGALILPYLPYFSNCREFDSHVPLWAVVESAAECKLPDGTIEFPDEWWRREIPPLPHQDDVKPIGPSDFMEFYPIADWCERRLYCSFEEDLVKLDVKPRWFEAEQGTSLFSIIRDPIDYFQYTGRDSSTVSADDGGGQRFIDSIDTLQTFVPAKVDRSPALNVHGGCAAGSCFPRKVTVDISYQQVDVHSKRIVQVKVLFDKFDKDASNDSYELQVKFYALNYQELVIKFAFSHELFLLLFTQIGVGTVIAALIYWIVVRLTTNLESPPKLRLSGFLWLTFPPALGGFLLGLVPISIVTSLVFYLMKGYLIFTPDTDPEGRRWLFPSSTRLHYSDVTIDPDELQSTRQGRTGLAFVTMALVSLYFTSKIFVPKNTSNNTMTEQHANDRALVNWKRGNLICSSIVMSLFLVIIVEWSFWSSFGTYIWEAIIFMKVLSIFVGSVVDKQLGEALLSAPVMTAMGLVQGIVTMSANDFMDFLLSYIVGFGFLILERMYVGPMQAEVFGWCYDSFISGVKHLQVTLPAVFGGSQDTKKASETAVTPKEDNNETVEPLLGSYASYSCDTLSLLYTPFIMLVIMLFRDEAEITKLYGIKEADMEYYVLFALTIIPFQIFADIFLHNALELLHGWKMHEYLEYCKVRFLQREVWWKGFERSTKDECIEESLRSMDQMCFSSQYYMLNTIHVNAMIYFVLGIEMITRANASVFGDPATLPIVAIILLSSVVVKWLLTAIARMFGLWRIKYEKRDWHANVLHSEENLSNDNWEQIQVKDHDQYQMEQRITSDTFRYKFLSYNRSWILAQLPDMITPRVSVQQRPYLINQLARVLGGHDGNYSSDSDSDDDEPDFEAKPMTATTRILARIWLNQAARSLRLRQLVAPLVAAGKGNECQLCLSRNLLQVESLHSISEIDEQYKSEYKTDEIDQVRFKMFWKRHQRYQTICLPCVQARKRKETEGIILDDRSSDSSSDGNGLASEDMSISASNILSNWYEAARLNLSDN